MAADRVECRSGLEHIALRAIGIIAGVLLVVNLVEAALRRARG